MAFERAVEPVAAACAGGPPTRRARPGSVSSIAAAAVRRRSAARRRSCGSSPRLASCTIARPGFIFARESVRLNSRASTSRRAGAGRAAAVGGEHARAARARAARPASPHDLRPRDARAAAEHRGGVDAEPVGAQRRRRGRGSPTSRAGCPAGRAWARPGNSPTMRPLARVPMTNPMPAAPWSVPDPFSSARRPNSDHTSVSTRSAIPRASRSRWNAYRLSAVILRFSGERRRPGRRACPTRPGPTASRSGSAGRRRASPPARRAGAGSAPRCSADRRRAACTSARRPCRAAPARARTPPANAAAVAAWATAGSREPASARPTSANAGSARSAGGPQAPGAQKPKSSGASTAATGTRAAASDGPRLPPIETPWSGLSAVPMRSSSRPSQPERSCGSSRADLPEVARDEVRLVRVVVADRRHHGDLALGVQRRERRGGRMPGQARVLAEHACRRRAARGSGAGGGSPDRRAARGSTGCRRRRRGTR